MLPLNFGWLANFTREYPSATISSPRIRWPTAVSVVFHSSHWSGVPSYSGMITWSWWFITFRTQQDYCWEVGKVRDLHSLGQGKRKQGLPYVPTLHEDLLTPEKRGSSVCQEIIPNRPWNAGRQSLKVLVCRWLQIAEKTETKALSDGQALLNFKDKNLVWNHSNKQISKLF